MADIEIKDEGSVILFFPYSDKGKRWIDENLQLESWQWHGGGAAVESRYAADIIEGMQNDGLEVTGYKAAVVPEESDMTLEDEVNLINEGIVAPPGRRL